jgi:hypothetical protein
MGLEPQKKERPFCWRFRWAAGAGSVANGLFQSFSYCPLGSATEGGVFKGRHFDRSVILRFCREFWMRTESGLSHPQGFGA